MESEIEYKPNNFNFDDMEQALDSQTKQVSFHFILFYYSFILFYFILNFKFESIFRKFKQNQKKKKLKRNH